MKPHALQSVASQPAGMPDCVCCSGMHRKRGAMQWDVDSVEIRVCCIVLWPLWHVWPLWHERITAYHDDPAAEPGSKNGPKSSLDCDLHSNANQG